MHNKTMNQMRFKLKKPRQTNYQISEHLATQKDVDLSRDSCNNKRFSSQYLSMARKFKIKIVDSQRHKRDFSLAQIGHGDRKRVKTQFSKEKDRYNAREGINLLEEQPQSQYVK